MPILAWILTTKGMAKLKCNHCGHLNPVKSEFMTFCDNCGKKLSNTFQEWKKFNAGKSFTYYKIELDKEEDVAIHPREINAPPKSQTALTIGLAIGFLFLAAGYYLGITGMQQFKKIMLQRPEISNMADAPNWRLMEDKAGNFKIRFPGTAIKDIQTQESEGETVYIVSYGLEADPDESGNHFYGLTFLKYPGSIINHSAMGKADLDEFFTTVINGSAGQVAGKVKSISERDFNEFPGRIALVSLQNREIEIIYWDVLIDNMLYMLQTIYPSGNAGNESIETFFNSFQLVGQ
jgi:hypothetical protein